MNEADISKYCDQMEEIKRRMNVIDFFLTERGHALYQPTTVETVYLQFRKILELIAMASLIANKKAMSEVYSGFEKSWNAEFLLKDIERINNNFFPKPIIEKPSSNPAVKSEWQGREQDYLTRDDFVKLYKKCGAIMHADNPLGRKTNYAGFFSQMSQWQQKIMNLLNCHQIQLAGDKNLYLIHMKEDRDDKVHGYTFSPVSGIDG